jgi:hypothetical protein
MKPEFPLTDEDKMVAPHALEVEYALILQRMINTVKEDPSQMRQTIYEFARARLKIDTSWAAEKERNRLATALETAILGVEDFSVRREEKERLSYQAPSAQIARPNPPSMPAAAAVERVQALTPTHEPAPAEILVPRKVYPYADIEAVVDVRTRALIGTLARFGFGMLLLTILVSAVYYRGHIAELSSSLSSSLPAAKVAEPATTSSVADASSQPSLSAEGKTDAGASGSVPFPLPTDYGVYALTNATLSELDLLPRLVPDKRIAMSAPVDVPSRTTLADGKARFIIFRRDLVGSAPDRVDIRVVAQVARALTFDAKGRPNLSNVSDSWNIRNVTYEFRVRPIAGKPEMLLVQSEKADFVLPAGRYVLVLKEQGYDFTVAGQVTDLAHCLERTDAANGSFYSECLKF